MPEFPFLTTTRFHVHLQPSAHKDQPVLTSGGFQECSGLEVTYDVAEHREGGANSVVVRRAGRATYSPIVLKRGMLRPSGGGVDTQLWDWCTSTTQGRPITRYDGLVEVWETTSAGPTQKTVAATWIFRRAVPIKIVGPQLNAAAGGIAIEELHLAIEHLRLVTGEGKGVA